MPTIIDDRLDEQARWVLNQIEYVTSGPDTVVLLSRRYARDLEDELKSTGAKLVPRARPDSRGNIWWWPYHLKDIGTRTGMVIEKWKSPNKELDWPGFKINRFDIPINFHMRTFQAKLRLRDLLAQRLRLKWAGKDATRYWIVNATGDTMYAHDNRNKAKRKRTWCQYGGEFRDDPNVLRLELRHQNTDAVRRNGLDDLSPTALRTVNPREHYAKNFTMVKLDPAYVSRRVKVAVDRFDDSPLCMSGYRRHVANSERGYLEWLVKRLDDCGHGLPMVRDDTTLEALLRLIPERFVVRE